MDEGGWLSYVGRKELKDVWLRCFHTGKFIIGDILS
jgi:hypothetical protein